MKADDPTRISLAVDHFQKGLELLCANGDQIPLRKLRKLYRKEMVKRILQWELKTNDIVTLITGGGERKVRINALYIPLDNREFLVLKALAAGHAELTPKVFLSTNSILEKVEVYRSELGMQNLWHYPTAEDVRRAIMALRRKIRDAGGNPELIESGRRTKGYRLSTPDVEVADGASEVQSIEPVDV
jgi:hypothetical protein